MNNSDKPWGVSVRSYLDDYVQIEWIKVYRTGYSSIHLHKRKLNIFSVHSGVLIVRIFKKISGEHRCTSARTLRAGDIYQVPKGVLHQFYAKTDVSATEVYLSVGGYKLDPNDIVRATNNGRDDPTEICCDVDPAAFRCSVCNAILGGESAWTPTIYLGAVRPVCLSCQTQFATR